MGALAPLSKTKGKQVVKIKTGVKAVAHASKVQHLWEVPGCMPEK